MSMLRLALPNRRIGQSPEVRQHRPVLFIDEEWRNAVCLRGTGRKVIVVEGAFLMAESDTTGAVLSAFLYTP